MTADNASNNGGIDILTHELELGDNFGVGFIHYRCLAHILNLCAREGLKCIEKELDTIRSFVKTIKSSSKRMQIFEQNQIDLIYGRYLIM